MKTARQIIDWFTRPVIAKHIGVSESAVKNAYLDGAEGMFPAAWFDGMEKLAGRPLPRECFRFTRAGRKVANEAAP